MHGSDKVPTDEPAPSASTGVRAFLENLTGPSKGGVNWLSDDEGSVFVTRDGELIVGGDQTQQDFAERVATLRWAGDSYAIEAAGKRHVWVNGHRIDAVKLMHGDMIEFEEHGPMSRFRLCQQSFPIKWPIDEILGDALSYARSSRRPLRGRLSTAVGEGLRRMVLQTTVFFRLSVIVALCAILAFGFVLYRNDKAIQARLEQDARTIEAVTVLLSQTREEALSENDLQVLRHQLETRMVLNAERLKTLEHRSDAASRIIAKSASSIAFLQGAFGLRHIESGELLHEVLGPDGQSIMTPFGQPRIEPFGDGPPAEFQFTGTGFLLENGQQLVTNRHVALPWTVGDRVSAFEASGLRPEILKLIAYLPEVPEPIDATLVSASETADVALLTIAPIRFEDRGLELAQSRPRIGDTVFLLGYPTGLKSLIAQAGQGFMEEMIKNDSAGFWTVADELSERRLVRPLASGGIVAQTNSGAILYDAETTVGGSGGPALNRDGQVIAINAAILPEFGGSNIGVPVSHLEDLLSKTADK
ncbi:trypsin-like peptidase domain-containing protein [Shimia abyssi]|uniref:Trypsin-like peptidase n=1 Tax=Shimia abyssi TaxID=1662395 RepID=A0A2P8EVT2_9RHOB|nr:trypsin-like peptidase domain-containing protein [Shimia abyssi]PSL13587.1 trypsin-like peptidase [Shimia abyssi]